MSPFVAGVVGSVLAGLATGVGALPVFFFKRVSHRLLDTLLGFSAGVMLAATSFSLVLPAIEMGGLVITSLGVLAGGIFLSVADRIIPHFHDATGYEGISSTLKKVWLFVIAIAIHNFPEGLAVGVGFGGGDMKRGISLAIGIGIQNMPEGLAVAFPLLREKYSRTKAFLIALATGLVEPLGGILGAGAVAIARPFLPFGLAFAAGTMLFVVSSEIIPETHSHGYEKEATLGVVAGFLVMMILDNYFG